MSCLQVGSNIDTPNEPPLIIRIEFLLKKKKHLKWKLVKIWQLNYFEIFYDYNIIEIESNS